jgi:hypothetical protein
MTWQKKKMLIMRQSSLMIKNVSSGEMILYLKDPKDKAGRDAQSGRVLA